MKHLLTLTFAALFAQVATAQTNKNEQGDRQKTVYGIRTTYITLQDFEAKSNREAAETLLEISANR